MRGEPCLCGAYDCPRCYPASWRRSLIRDIHYERHDLDCDVEDCPECEEAEYREEYAAEMQYDQRREEARDGRD